MKKEIRVITYLMRGFATKEEIKEELEKAPLEEVVNNILNWAVMYNVETVLKRFKARGL